MTSGDKEPSPVPRNRPLSPTQNRARRFRVKPGMTVVVYEARNDGCGILFSPSLRPPSRSLEQHSQSRVKPKMTVVVKPKMTVVVKPKMTVVVTNSKEQTCVY